MEQPFVFPKGERWDDLVSFIDASKNLSLSPLQRLFLSGGGTLTTSLHAFLTTPVHIEVIRQNLFEADRTLVQFLELKESEKGLLREIWILSEKNEKLVYACSFLPLNGLNPSLHEALHSKKQSLGDLIEKMRLPHLKDKIRYGTLHSEALAIEFQAPDNSLLWYRHFRLSAPQHLLASIYEVFSPKLFEQ